MARNAEELDIRTADGVARAWSWRGGDGARPGVLMYPDAYGVRPVMQQMAERIAGLGYVVLLPNVFYRAGDYPPFDKASVWNDPPERERLMKLIQALTQDRLRADASAYLDALVARPDVRRDRIGVAGYCMGGRLAFLTAALQPDRIRASASFHPGGLVIDAPESPHRLAERVKASVYVGFADQDRGATPEHQGALAAALAAADVAYCIELYRGKRHGFAVVDHPGAYDPEAAERHWRRLESFFRETLG